MDAKPVRIYSSKDVPRLRYIAGIILGDILSSWLAESWMMVLGGIFAAFILYSPGGVIALARKIGSWAKREKKHGHP